MKKVYIAFGGNIGDPKETILKAIDLLCGEGLLLEKCSSFWYTEPMGDKNQPWYTNCVALFKCENLIPHLLLEKTQKIEYLLGRTRVKNNQNAARTIDIDMLDFNGISLRSDLLILPHERMFIRAFVLVPLMELEPEYMYGNKNIQSYLAEIEYRLDGNKIYQN